MSAQGKKDNLQYIALSQLFLDKDNPRLGQDSGVDRNQRDLLNVIVQTFGVDDVLSSISVSGFFEAEPLVCRDNGDETYTVVEGNRRLCACLILSDDARAVDEEKRTLKYQALHKKHSNPPFDPVPAIVFGENEDKKLMLSYLGVRHIVSTKDWDSFAKAAWVARTIEQGGGITLQDISELIGDQTNSIKRMLEGYNFIKQLEKSQEFDPKATLKKGRGSNVDYPFSWVYTALGYTNVRNFVGFIDEETPRKDPIPIERIDNAALLVRSMFGDESESFRPAIDDSRQIKKLATVVADTRKVKLLLNGKSVEEIEHVSKPPKEFLSSIFIDVQDLLKDAIGRIAEDEQQINAADAKELLDDSKRIGNLALKVFKSLEEISKGDEKEAFSAFED